MLKLQVNLVEDDVAVGLPEAYSHRPLSHQYLLVHVNSRDPLGNSVLSARKQRNVRQERSTPLQLTFLGGNGGTTQIA
jgi:hypothetical protein